MISEKADKIYELSRKVKLDINAILKFLSSELLKNDLAGQQAALKFIIIRIKEEGEYWNLYLSLDNKISEQEKITYKSLIEDCTN